LVKYNCVDPDAEARAHAQQIGGKTYFTVGISMEPLIVQGDVIVVDVRFPFKKCEVGDVLTYKAVWLPEGSLPVTHRLSSWYMFRTSAVMDGINNDAYENGRRSLDAENYIGKVVKIYTKRRGT
jgi:signal peptidase I